MPGFCIDLRNAVLSNSNLLALLSGNHRIELTGLADDFEDGIMGNRWRQFDEDYPSTEDSGSLSISLGTGISSGSGYHTRSATLDGDFDIQVNFSNFAATSGSGAYPRIILRFYVDSDNSISLLYMRNPNNSSSYYYAVDSRVDGTTQSSNASATTTLGRLRIVRSGTTFYAYYGTNVGWTQLQTRGSFPTTAGSVSLYGLTWTTASTVSGRFDDLKVNSGSHFPTSSPTAILPKIGGGAEGQKWVWDGASLYIPENCGISGATVPKYQYCLFEDDEESDLEWNGSWLTQAELKAAIGTTTLRRWLKLQTQFLSNGTIGCNIASGIINANDISRRNRFAISGLRRIYG